MSKRESLLFLLGKAKLRERLSLLFLTEDKKKKILTVPFCCQNEHYCSPHTGISANIKSKNKSRFCLFISLFIYNFYNLLLLLFLHFFPLLLLLYLSFPFLIFCSPLSRPLLSSLSMTKNICINKC